MIFEQMEDLGVKGGCEDREKKRKKEFFCVDLGCVGAWFLNVERKSPQGNENEM